jgi:hypothetical protein
MMSKGLFHFSMYVMWRSPYGGSGSRFGVLSTTAQHVGLTALNSFYALAPSFDGFKPLQHRLFPDILLLPILSQATYF